MFKAATDVSVFTVRQMAHMHNFAATRTRQITSAPRHPGPPARRASYVRRGAVDAGSGSSSWSVEKGKSRHSRRDCSSG